MQSIHDEYFAREDGKLKGAKRQKREWIGDTARLGSRVIAEIKRSDVTRLLDEVEDDTVQEQRGAFSPSCLRSSIGMRRTARSLMSRAGVDADIAERCRAQDRRRARDYGRHAFYKEKKQALAVLAGGEPVSPKEIGQLAKAVSQ